MRMAIRIMRVLVSQPLVLVPMRVRFKDRPVVMMLVMRVVNMSMFMRQSFMNMLMFVPFGEVQPEA